MDWRDEVAQLTATAVCPICHEEIANCKPEDVEFTITEHKKASHPNG